MVLTRLRCRKRVYPIHPIVIKLTSGQPHSEHATLSKDTMMAHARLRERTRLRGIGLATLIEFR